MILTRVYQSNWKEGKPLQRDKNLAIIWDATECVSPTESTIYMAADHFLYPAEKLWAMYEQDGIEGGKSW